MARITQTTFDHLPLVLTVKETSKVLGLSLTKTYELVRIPDFPAIHVDRRILIPKAALEAWLCNPSNYK